MVKRDDLKNYLDDLLVPAEFDDYGPNGLQIEGREEIRQVGFAVSATRDSVEVAVASGVDALIVHPRGFLALSRGANPNRSFWEASSSTGSRGDQSIWLSFAFGCPYRSGQRCEIGPPVGNDRLGTLRPFEARPSAWSVGQVARGGLSAGVVSPDRRDSISFGDGGYSQRC